MSDATLEERVTTLEQLVDALRRKTETAERSKDWRRTVGMFDGDPIMREINELPRSKLRGIGRTRTLNGHEASCGESHPARD